MPTWISWYLPTRTVRLLHSGHSCLGMLLKVLENRYFDIEVFIKSIKIMVGLLFLVGAMNSFDGTLGSVALITVPLLIIAYFFLNSGLNLVAVETKTTKYIDIALYVYLFITMVMFFGILASAD